MKIHRRGLIYVEGKNRGRIRTRCGSWADESDPPLQVHSAGQDDMVVTCKTCLKLGSAYVILIGPTESSLHPVASLQEGQMAKSKKPMPFEKGAKDKKMDKAEMDKAEMKKMKKKGKK